MTNNHPVLTGKIVIAHLKETLDYYRRLKIMELEIVIHKALVAKDADVLVVDGDPSTDMADIKRVRQVLVAGSIVGTQ